MNVRELKDSGGSVFSPKTSSDSVYMSGTTVTVTSKIQSVDNSKLNNSGTNVYKGCLVVDSTTSTGYYDEGIRVTKGYAGYSNLMLGCSKTTHSGTEEGQWWIGSNYERLGAKLYITYNGSAGNTYFDGNSGLVAPGFYVTSSRKYKENIKPTRVNGLDLIDSIEVVDFTYKTDEKHYPKVGFIAEDTDPLLSTPEQKTMDFSNCIGVMMKAIQELSAKVKTLTNKLESLTPPLLKHLIHKRLPSKCINSKLILKEVA